ncbi:MAG: N-succinylarginine dihydrolase [Chlamydiae bacterium]|nr:N-succinylarginine dihydrolase [Chlamydiota bacterium]
MNYQEVFFHTLPGPTFHLGGLSYGNLASMSHRYEVANPKQAALESLDLMEQLHKWGVPQIILPPHPRPLTTLLSQLGYSAEDPINPHIISTIYSSSFMWMANVASITPSCDTLDGKCHISPANLQATFHRNQEVAEWETIFETLFHNTSLFTTHPPLPSGGGFGDEGAGNQIRFCQEIGEKGFYLFVYGKRAFEAFTGRFPIRQVLEASDAIIHRHKLPYDQLLTPRQSKRAIDAGVFHNDLISFGHKNWFVFHEYAFEEQENLLTRLPLNLLEVTEKQLPLRQAIDTYFFNSILLTDQDGTLQLLAPSPCASLNLDWLPFPITFIDLSQSLKAGGGPACLTLRTPLNTEERNALPSSLFYSDTLHKTLSHWIMTHYPDHLTPEDLKDPHLLTQTHTTYNACPLPHVPLAHN